MIDEHGNGLTNEQMNYLDKECRTINRTPIECTNTTVDIRYEWIFSDQLDAYDAWHEITNMGNKFGVRFNILESRISFVKTVTLAEYVVLLKQLEVSRQ